MPTDLNPAEFEKLIADEKGTLVDFYASWCGPCQEMAPIVKELAHDNEEKINVGKVDVEKNHELAAKYNILSLPTFIFFKEGKIAGHEGGVMSEKELQAKIEKYLL